MEISLMMPTHGLLYRDENDAFLPAPDRHVDVVEVAKLAERLAYHSLWFSDHVLVTKSSDSGHPANWSGKRAYPGRSYMLDGLVCMGAVAAATDRIRFSPSVLIAPYRHPLSDARQLATVDVLSNGRLIVGVGPGWMREEFESLNLPFESRARMLEECLEIYLRSWRDDWVEYDGDFYKFSEVSMDPKPIQQPPPIVLGAGSKGAARRAAKYSNGMYMLMLDPYPDIDRHRPLFDVCFAEAEKLGRAAEEYELSVMVSALPTDASDPASQASNRKVLTGTADQITEDLHQFAASGYSRCVVHLEVRSGKYTEYIELVQRFGEEIIPIAKGIQCRVPAL